ncbi:MAG: class I adenylate-forming enzyme family protein [Pseudomonadales bacterium]
MSASTYTVKDATILFCEWNNTKELIIDKHERYTGARLNNEARSFAQCLRSFGIGKGDTVALMGVASCRFFAAYFAVQKLGAVSCNIHVKESAEFVTETLAEINAKTLICSGQLVDIAHQAITQLNSDVKLISLDDVSAHGQDYNYSAIVLQYPSDEPDVAVHADDTAVIILSSGSTGVPKGIVHSNGNFVRWLRVAPTLFGAVHRNTRFLVNVGTSFAAWPFSAIPILYAGGSIVLMEGFTPETFCQAVEKERITMAGPVPTMIRMLEPSITTQYDLSSFEMVLCAGEPPSSTDIDRVLSWANTDIRCLYLASESAPGASTYWELRDQSVHNKPVCAGRPIPGADARIINPDGGIDDVLDRGETGEIALKGPTIASAYLNNKALSEQRFRDGWWRSGDLGHLDKDGYLFVEGRVDNIINTGGIKVHGEEVETCLVKHPAVAQVAVIGAPDAKWGMRIEAHIASAGAVTEDELNDFAEQQGLAAFKRPKRYVFHAQLPIGVTGKLDRVSLREQNEH